MSTARVRSAPSVTPGELCQLAVRACDVAKAAAAAVGDAISSGSAKMFDVVREREEELDMLDRQINEGVTITISTVSEEDARGLLACLKLVLELERIGDLLLHFANRARAVAPRLEADDVRDLTAMASLLEKMLGDATSAFVGRDLGHAREVFRADSELDRLRNLLFVRHIENPEHVHRTESFHVVFMSQTLERAGDHTKNIAEEVVHLVTGRSMRHLMRESDRSIEQMWADWMRKKQGKK
ncbi:MAG: phosphate uptake regulator PhoU [Candidatus Korobacteraceae bacterium]